GRSTTTYRSESRSSRPSIVSPVCWRRSRGCSRKGSPLWTTCRSSRRPPTIHDRPHGIRAVSAPDPTPTDPSVLRIRPRRFGEGDRDPGPPSRPRRRGLAFRPPGGRACPGGQTKGRGLRSPRPPHHHEPRLRTAGAEADLVQIGPDLEPGRLDRLDHPTSSK